MFYHFIRPVHKAIGCAYRQTGAHTRIVNIQTMTSAILDEHGKRISIHFGILGSYTDMDKAALAPTWRFFTYRRWLHRDCFAQAPGNI